MKGRRGKREKSNSDDNDNKKSHQVALILK